MTSPQAGVEGWPYCLESHVSSFFAINHLRRQFKNTDQHNTRTPTHPSHLKVPIPVALPQTLAARESFRPNFRYSTGITGALTSDGNRPFHRRLCEGLRLWPLAGSFESEVVAQDLPVIENDRPRQIVLMKYPRQLGIVSAAGNSISNRDEDRRHGVMALIAARIGIGVKLIR